MPPVVSVLRDRVVPLHNVSGLRKKKSKHFIVILCVYWTVYVINNSLWLTHQF